MVEVQKRFNFASNIIQRKAFIHRPLDSERLVPLRSFMLFLLKKSTFFSPHECSKLAKTGLSVSIRQKHNEQMSLW